MTDTINTVTPFLTILIVPLIIGISFFAIGLYALIKSKKTDREFREKGIPVTAKIHNVDVSYFNRGNTRGNKTLKVDVDVIFHTKYNEEIITKADFGSTRMKAGQEIEIMYLKDNPKKIRVNTKGNAITAYVISGIFIVLGLAAITAVLVGMLNLMQG
ncbi:MAG: DUF3592 domain-containing protein [Treponema sp.]|nr:DUF3592 domain-containing protein [Treponema sp.]